MYNSRDREWFWSAKVWKNNTSCVSSILGQNLDVHFLHPTCSNPSFHEEETWSAQLERELGYAPFQVSKPEATETMAPTQKQQTPDMVHICSWKLCTFTSHQKNTAPTLSSQLYQLPSTSCSSAIEVSRWTKFILHKSHLYSKLRHLSQTKGQPSRKQDARNSFSFMLFLRLLQCFALNASSTNHLSRVLNYI